MIITHTKSGKITLRMPQNVPCRFRGQRYYSPLEGRYIFSCGCHAAPSFPGCIEDWRTKKLVCLEYQPKK